MATAVKQPLGTGKKNQAKIRPESIDSGLILTTDRSPMRTTNEMRKHFISTDVYKDKMNLKLDLL